MSLPDGDLRDHESQRRRGRRQHQRLDEQLADDAAAAGAERAAHGDLALSRRGARVDEDGDVHGDHTTSSRLTMACITANSHNVAPWMSTNG